MSIIFKILYFFKSVLCLIFKVISDICFLVVFVYGIVHIPMFLNYNPVIVDSKNSDNPYDLGTLIYYKEYDVPTDVLIDDVIVYTPVDERYVVHKVSDILVDGKTIKNANKEEEITEEEAINAAENGNAITQESSEDEGEKKEPEYSFVIGTDNYNKNEPNTINFSQVAGHVYKINVPYIGYYVDYIKRNIMILYVAIGIFVFDLLFGGKFISNKRIKKVTPQQ